MSVNRYLVPKYLEYNSQFVPQEIPWDILQANMEKKQNKRDNLSKDLANSLVQPTGMQYANDLWGNTQELDDYKNSLERSNEINARVDEVSKKLANTEVNKEIDSDLAEIQKLKNQAETENAVYAERKKIYDDYQKALQTGKINPGDHRAIQYQKEIDKMKSNSSYVPTIHGIQEAFDNNEFVKKAVGDIKVEANTSMSKDAGYFNKSENRRITREKILNSLTGAFNSDSSLRDDITTEAETYAYQHGINDIYAKVKLNDGSEATIFDIVKQQRFDNLMQNAEKYIYSDTKQTLSADSSYWKGLDLKKEIDAKLPIIGEGIEKDSRSDMERTIDNVTRVGDINKSKIDLFNVNTQIARLKKGGIDVNNIAQYRELAAQQQAYETSIREYETNFSKIGEELLPEAKNLVLDGLRKELQQAESQAAIVSKRSTSPLAVKGGSSTANVDTPEAKAAREKVRKLKENISLVEKQDFSNFDKVRSSLEGTDAGNTFNALINNKMTDASTQQEYNSFIFAGKDNAQLTQQVQAYLKTSPYNFQDSEGNSVSFNNFDTFDNSFAVDVKDGKLYVSVTGQNEIFGTKKRVSETIEISPKDVFFKDLLVQTRDNAYEAAVGGNQQAANVYNEINNSLFLTAPVTGLDIKSVQDLDKKAAALPRVGMSTEFNLENPKDLEHPFRGMATKNAQGQFDVRFSFYNYRTGQYETKDVTQSQTNFKDVSEAVKLSGLIQQP